MRIRQDKLSLARFQNTSERNNPNQKKRINSEFRHPENTQTATLIHGVHTSPHKVNTKPRNA